MGKMKTDTMLETEIAKAKEADAEGIKQIIDSYTFKEDGSGNLIPLTLAQIKQAIKHGWFYTAKAGEAVIGCGSVAEYNGIAEFRSWAVREEYHGPGIGKKLAEACMEQAKKKGYSTLHALTQEQNVSRLLKLGFHSNGTGKENSPPEKLAKDCARCLIYDKCNETAMTKAL